MKRKADKETCYLLGDRDCEKESSYVMMKDSIRKKETENHDKNWNHAVFNCDERNATRHLFK